MIFNLGDKMMRTSILVLVATGQYPNQGFENICLTWSKALNINIGDLEYHHHLITI